MGTTSAAPPQSKAFPPRRQRLLEAHSARLSCHADGNAEESSADEEEGESSSPQGDWIAGITDGTSSFGPHKRLKNFGSPQPE